MPNSIINILLITVNKYLDPRELLKHKQVLRIILSVVLFLLGDSPVSEIQTPGNHPKESIQLQWSSWDLWRSCVGQHNNFTHNLPLLFARHWMNITNESLDPQTHFNSSDFNGRVSEHLGRLSWLPRSMCWCLGQWPRYHVRCRHRLTHLLAINGVGRPAAMRQPRQKPFSRILWFLHLCCAVRSKTVVTVVVVVVVVMTTAAAIVNTETAHSQINAVSGIRTYTYLSNVIINSSFFQCLTDRSTISYNASSPHSGSHAPSFNLQYPLVSFRSSNCCSRLLPRLTVTSTLPSIFPSITCFRR